MSVESVKQFIDRIKNDTAFRAEFSALSDDAARQHFLTEQGFKFTTQEMTQLADELGEADLDSVVGGTMTCESGYAHCSSQCTAQVNCPSLFG